MTNRKQTTIDLETGEVTAAETQSPDSFSTFVLNHSHGDFSRDASQQFNQLIDEVGITGKKGSITIKIDVAPGGGADSAQLSITDKIDVKLPKPTRPSSVYFFDGNRDLSRDRPGYLTVEQEIARNTEEQKDNN